jgi:uncharacterized protein
MITFMNAKNITPVVVKETPDKGIGVFAAKDFARGEIVLVGRGIKILSVRTLHSIQMNLNLHVLLDEPAVFLNHCCSPNVGVRNNQYGGYDFVAIADIVEGEEIVYDYETTETAFAGQFQCQCHASNCRRQLSGFVALPLEVRESYGEFIADYLKSKHRE